MSQKYNDGLIINLLQAGDSKIFKHLVKEQLPVITYFVLKNGGNAEDAKDIFQEALFILIQKIKKGEFVLACSLSTYLYAVCKNIWLLDLEKRKAAYNYQMQILNQYHEDNFSEKQDCEFYEKIFMKSFQEINEQCQTILKLYWTKLAPEKIATTLDYSYGFLRKKKSECMKEFKRRIMSHPDFAELEKNLNINQKIGVYRK